MNSLKHGIKVEKQLNNTYKVYYDNNVFLGDIFAKEDGFYDFWPEYPGRGGYWPAYLLREIANKLDQLNEPYQKDIDTYFANKCGC